MSLSAGDKLGPYEILGPLGAGGMGEVYRARDTKLKREVALKALPEAFARDPDRMARFQREAEVLASLNHPNIAHIYGVEECAFVMELVEGETLTQIVARGPLPVETALDYAKQMADALEAAHEKGVVHRDVKPANVMLTAAGLIKVLDFGLAAVMQGPASSAGDRTNSPTLTMRATEMGVIMGTAGYMSPEQAAGKAVDKRADIWSFGVVLWEMLTGQRLFEGETMSHTLADVLRAPIEFDRLPKKTPAAIRELVKRCLDRDVKTRLRDIGEARVAIQRWLANPVSAEIAPARPRMGWVAIAVAVVAVAFAAAIALVHFREEPPVAETARFEIAPPPSAQFTCCLSISPDGRKIVFTAQKSTDARPNLWVRALDAVEAKVLVQNVTGGLTLPDPFWSPDSQFVAISTNGKLKKVEASGGPAQTICDTPPGFVGGAWNPDGVIITGGTGGLIRVPAAGGEPSPLTTLDPSRQERDHIGPAFLPDGRHFLYLRRSDRGQNNGIYVGSLDAKPEQQDTRRLLAADLPAVYAASPGASTGHILFLRENTLMAQPFDAGKMALAGDAVPVGESVQGHGAFAVSTTGTLIYRTGAAGANRWLTWFDRQGKTLGQLGDPADYGASLALSPDGTRVASTRGPSATSDIWLVDSRGVSSRFTFDPASDREPIWSPDGTRIIFASNRAGHYDLYQKPANLAGDDALVLKSDEDKYPASWSRDGHFLIFWAVNPITHADLWVLPEPAGGPGDHQPVPWLRTEFNERDGRFSPDGHWIAYLSDESGRYEVYVRPFMPGNSPAGKWQVSKDGASPLTPRWRSDGKELFFSNTTGILMAVEVSTTPVFHSGNPEPSFRLPGVWDVTGDGKRFVGPAEAAGDSAPVTIKVALNWAARLTPAPR
ncbi:Serine/threonine protein kinase [Candidatus Sulfopaludibacter sp. SbA6]|nr:Serine/threonine protein kinase [Candidatus Sulfopaludibacter sp. SbA6]